MGLYGQYLYCETEFQISRSETDQQKISSFTYKSEKMRSTLNKSGLARPMKMKVKFPFPAQIKCRYEPV